MAQKAKLFVGGLGQNATENSLYETFEKFGKICDACIVYDKETKNSRGFGYVLFEDPNDAEAAMNAVRGTMIDGKEINVEYANAKDPAKEAAKRMNRYGGGGGGGRGGPPRGRGGPPRGRGGPPRGMGYRGRGPPERRPPPSRYDGYGGYDDQYPPQGRYERDYPPERDVYGYGPPPRARDPYEAYPPQRPDPRRDGPPPPRRDAPPPRDGGYDRYPPPERERYPPADRGRPANPGGADRYHQPERNNYSGDGYNSQPVDRYGGPPPTSAQRSYGRDW